MADIRIKDLATTATTTASDDFMAVDGTTNGTRKLSAAAPAFLTSVTTPSLTSPASTNLTLAAGGTNQSVVLTPSGTGGVGIGTASPQGKLEVSASAVVMNVVSPDNASINLIRGQTTNYNNLRFGTGNSTTYTEDWSFQVRADQDSGNQLSITRAGTNTNTFVINNSDGNVGIGTATPGAYRLNVAGGNVYVASSTAGSSGAGALVVAGGISAGQSAQASWFGGAVTVGDNIIINNYDLGIFTRQNSLNNNNSNFLGFTAASAGLLNLGNNGANEIRLGNSAIGGSLNIVVNNTAAATSAHNGTVALTIASTGAATFAGAVTIAGNVGFYNNAPVAKPTSVAVTAAAIHAALVTLNLISA